MLRGCVPGVDIRGPDAHKAGFERHRKRSARTSGSRQAGDHTRTGIDGEVAAALVEVEETEIGRLGHRRTGCIHAGMRDGHRQRCRDDGVDLRPLDPGRVQSLRTLDGLQRPLNTFEEVLVTLQE